jgi:hypothetical protein
MHFTLLTSASAFLCADTSLSPTDSKHSLRSQGKYALFHTPDGLGSSLTPYPQRDPYRQCDFTRQQISSLRSRFRAHLQGQHIRELLLSVLFLVSGMHTNIRLRHNNQVLTFSSGSTSAYCGKGCRSGYGNCKNTPSPPVSPPSTHKLTTDARCGKEGKGQTCLGSRWGNCCSQYSYWSVK